MSSASELARQVREAEALVKQLERGEKVTPSQSHPVQRRGGRYGDGPGLIPMHTHSGGGGKSLIQKIREDIQEALKMREDAFETAKENYEENLGGMDYEDGLVDGMCHALGILRGNEGQVERQWAESVYREAQRRDEEGKETGAKTQN